MSHDFNDTLMFVKVVEKGSFTAAALALGVPKATLSRKISELEQRLGTRLLKRTTRKLGLTEAGTLYYERSARIAADLTEAESAVSQLNSAPRGWLRFTAPYSLGSDAITPLLPEFMARYPDVRLDMHLTNDKIDLVASEMDVAIRVGNLPDSTLSARRLATLQMHVYASPDYLARHGEPLQPADLEHHRALALSQMRHNGRYVWDLYDGERRVDVPVSPVLVANDPPSLFNAVVSGVGVTLLPDSFGKVAVKQGRLRTLLNPWAGPTRDLNAVFPPGRMHTPKVRAFVDFLSEHLVLDNAALRILCFQAATEECGHCAQQADIVGHTHTHAPGPSPTPAETPALAVVAPGKAA
jgi:LysR family transcriptional regulator, regulator for bpeEF and oprC